METYHIHINGIVQGVGFRPLVYQLAREMQLNGYVKNGSNGVNICFNASEQEANTFFRRLQQQAPSRSKIISSDFHKTGKQVFSDFSIIIEDDHCSEKQVLMSPDTAMCAKCRAELNDVNNRRYRYPFITCTQCGPRYSIVNSLPYERHSTSMQSFGQCKSCKREYNDINDRRFFSQTNSCADCGIKLRLLKNDLSVLANDAANVLINVKNFLEQGKILAVKGIGGYLLICDANRADTIQLLRNRKHRITKPFAILYPDIEAVNNDFELKQQEKELLQIAEAPIVLLYPKPKAFDTLSVKDIAPGLKKLGVMIPSNPLLELIAKDFGKPLIATSANISGSPIIYTNEEAIKYLFDIADYIVSNDREIIIPQDDSVVQVAPCSGQQIILRRSRGYAPSFLDYKTQKRTCILSTGGFLKSSFTLAINGNVFVSQFLGSGERFESQQMYKRTLQHWLALYQVKPNVIIADAHPGYFSHEYAVELAGKYGSELKFVQHHEAHFAAVLAENNLFNSVAPVMGVVWDGTGLGTDGNIWGGEFFKYENNEMLRCYHFDYFPSIAGDKIALEPRIAALCAANDTWPSSDMIREKFTDTEWNNYQALLNNTSLFTSSAGRIFDAVASLLGICDKQNYEGEAAMYLQAMAEEYVNENGFTMNEAYFRDDSHYYRIPTASLVQGILMDIKKGKDKKYIAAKFHYSLVCLLGIVAANINVTSICFSGGVFQNALLVDWIKNKYNDKYQLYFHINLSPNDENISFGQMAYYENRVKSILIDEQGNRAYREEQYIGKEYESLERINQL